MTEIYHSVVKGRPIVKKNTKKVYRGGRVVYSEKYRIWEQKALLSIRPISKTINEYIYAKFEFHFKGKKSEPDTSNLIEGIQDVLQKRQIIKDDKLIKRLTAEKFFGEEQKTVVTLYSLD